MVRKSAKKVKMAREKSVPCKGGGEGLWLVGMLMRMRFFCGFWEKEGG